MRPAILSLLLAGLSISTFLCGWSSGRAFLMGRLLRSGALRPPVAPLSLQDVSDVDLTVELLARSYCQALDRGDEAQMAMIRRTAEHLPPLQERLAAVSAEQPNVFTGGRAQA